MICMDPRLQVEILILVVLKAFSVTVQGLKITAPFLITLSNTSIDYKPRCVDPSCSELSAWTPGLQGKIPIFVVKGAFSVSVQGLKINAPFLIPLSNTSIYYKPGWVDSVDPS